MSEAIRKILIPSDKCSVNVSDSGVHLSGRIKKETRLPDTIRKIWIPLDKWGSHSKGTQSLHLNLSQLCSIVAMVAHKAAFDAGEVERLVILVIVILGAEAFIPVAGHILLEESYKVFEEFKAIISQFIAELATGDDDTPVRVVAYALAVLPEADINIQASLVNTYVGAVVNNLVFL